MSRSKNRKIADLISGSEVTGLHTVALTGDYNELENRVTNTNELTNGAGFITVSEVPVVDATAITEGDTSVTVQDSGTDGKVVVRVNDNNTLEINAGGIVVPTGTTAQRDPNAPLGSLRYNTSVGFFETLTASGWGSISAPPQITGVLPSSFNGAAGQTFTITGTFFDSAAEVTFIGSNGTQYPATTTTFVSATELRAINATLLPAINEPFRVKVTSGSGLSTEGGSIDAGSVPTWNTPAGSLGSSTWGSAVSTSVSASDEETSVSGYSLSLGSLPLGLSFNTNTGAITGTSSNQANTLYTFGVTASDTSGNTNERQFSYQINNQAPIWTSPAPYSTSTAYKGQGTSISLSATDPEGVAVSYALASGSALPAGLSLNGSTISGTPTSRQTSLTEIVASDGFMTSSRVFSINVLAPFKFNSFFRANSANISVRQTYRGLLSDSSKMVSLGFGLETVGPVDHAYSNQYNPTSTNRYYMPYRTTDDGDNNQYVSSNGPTADFTSAGKIWYDLTPFTGTPKLWADDFIDIDGFRYWATGSSVGTLTYFYLDADEDSNTQARLDLASELEGALVLNGITIGSDFY